MAPGAAWAAGAPAASLDDAGAAGADGVGGAASGGGDLPSAEAGGALQKRRTDASPAVRAGVSAMRSGLMDNSSRRWGCVLGPTVPTREYSALRAPDSATASRCHRKSQKVAIQILDRRPVLAAA